MTGAPLLPAETWADLLTDAVMAADARAAQALDVYRQTYYHTIDALRAEQQAHAATQAAYAALLAEHRTLVDTRTDEHFWLLIRLALRRASTAPYWLLCIVQVYEAEQQRRTRTRREAA